MSLSKRLILSAFVKMFGSLCSFIINAPVVDGSETKSKQINWKSSSTIVFPLSLLQNQAARRDAKSDACFGK
jgi:hypothetical protein